MDIITSGIAWPLLAWVVAGALILAGAVAVDARERGQSAALWFVLALLFPGFGALAYLVLRPAAEPASLPTILPDRPLSSAERPASASLSTTPGRGSVPAARDLPRPESPGPREPARPDVPRAEPSSPREAGRPETAPGAGLPPARDAAPPEGAPAAPRPVTTGVPEPVRPTATPLRSDAPAATAHSGTMEWRRGVGVLPAAAPPAPPATEPQARPEPRRGRGVPPWVFGAGAALLVLAVAALALPRLGAPPSQAPATPIAAPSPTAAAALDAEPAPVVAAEPTPRPSSYTVEDGDTLGGIAAQFDTSVQALMDANGIDDADTVFVGQQLTIP